MSWLTTLLPFVEPLAQLLLPILVGLIVVKANAWFGVKIDAGHREALHSALATGVSLALVKARGGAPTVHELAEKAAEYALERGAPDAVAHFKLGVEAVAAMAEAKVQAAPAALEAAGPA